ncbi:MAG TPA: FAD-containing oxidoreductase [Burkholderiales bacterium]|jgi:pyruvate/2-oxoglutarate dehydrogenase complex dihydrolipoamide dehydrogenase (E3) component|nr:FAD-containing oxidoreductase [Burkholderiales bacterium]
MAERFSAIVVGTGQAAPALCARLDKEGLKTALIERKLLGGTCVNVGCIPTKTLVASARAARMAQRASEYGIALDSPARVDMKAVKARKDGVVRQSSEGVEKWIARMKNVELIRGHARFTGAHTLAVAGRTLEADKIFLNVGARAFSPPIPGLKDVPSLDNVSMMEIDAVPEHLVIIGGSYIGLEFAQMYRRFGAAVTVVEKGPRLIAREDEDVSEEIRAILAREGIAVRTAAECMEVRNEKGRIVVGLSCQAGAPAAEGTHLLMAVGRKPNTDDLGLEKANVQVDERGFIQVDDQCRTSVEGVWALGDCNGRGAFTHTSYNDYEIVAANLFDNDARRISDRIPAYALFIDPPLGRAGMTETEAIKSGKRVLAAKMAMAHVGRAREAGETQGFMKIAVDADSKALLGAAILGMNGDEIVHSLLDMMYARKPYTTIQRAVHIHPTVTELIPTLLGSLKPVQT